MNEKQNSAVVHRIGIFSGTFDPIHLGHIESCLAAKAICNLEQVLVLIEQKPHRKNNVTSYVRRRDMVELALSDLPLINFFDTNESNITFASTLPILKKRFGKAVFVMIVGSDMLTHLSDWGISDAVELCIVLRKNTPKNQLKKQIAALVKAHPKLRYTIVPPVRAASSSGVRNQIAREGISDYLHRNVAQYIKQHKLYETSSSKSK